ncbi:DUF1493 family protein (plasmid) [Pantoea stewartii]
MMNTGSVLNPIKKHIREMTADASPSTGKEVVLPEDAYDFMVEYAGKFDVDLTHFEFGECCSNKGIRFLPNAILPKYMSRDHHEPSPLTIRTQTESAEIGRWLFLLILPSD